MILSDEIYARIGAAIADGTFPPGHRLRDVELAQQLGVSRTPVEKHCNDWSASGSSRSRSAATPVSPRPATHCAATTGEFAAYFLGNALSISLSRCSDDDLAELVATVDAALAGIDTGNAAAVFSAASRLGIVAARATGNSVFDTIIHETSIVVERNLRGWSGVRAEAAPRRENWQLLRDRIAARDAAGAEETIRRLYGVTPGAVPPAHP